MTFAFIPTALSEILTDLKPYSLVNFCFRECKNNFAFMKAKIGDWSVKKL